MDDSSNLVKALRKSGYRIEPVPDEGEHTCAVYFPVKEPNFTRARRDVSIWEQLEIVAQMQHWWADNQVSVTVTFNEDEAKQIDLALQLYETRLKSVSFLPINIVEREDNEYVHPPLQPMTEKEYNEAVKKLKPLKLKDSTETEGFEQKYCDNDLCEIPSQP